MFLNQNMGLVLKQTVSERPKHLFWFNQKIYARINSFLEVANDLKWEMHLLLLYTF